MNINAAFIQQWPSNLVKQDGARGVSVKIRVCKSSQGKNKYY
jgi:hypothetical protein